MSKRAIKGARVAPSTGKAVGATPSATGVSPWESISFCGPPMSDADYASVPFVILPIPFDKTSTWLKGADKGPAAIIEASRYLEFYDIETDSEVLKKGIFTAEPIRAASPSVLVKKTDSAVSKYLKDNKLI